MNNKICKCQLCGSETEHEIYGTDIEGKILFTNVDTHGYVPIDVHGKISWVCSKCQDKMLMTYFNIHNDFKIPLSKLIDCCVTRGFNNHNGDKIIYLNLALQLKILQQIYKVVLTECSNGNIDNYVLKTLCDIMNIREKSLNGK